MAKVIYFGRFSRGPLLVLAHPSMVLLFLTPGQYQPDPFPALHQPHLYSARLRLQRPMRRGLENGRLISTVDEEKGMCRRACSKDQGSSN